MPRLLTPANALSVSRLLLLPICVGWVASGSYGLALAVFLVAVVTDLLDGPVARARAEVSTLGGLLDHSSDALFCSSVLATLAWLGVINVWLWPVVLLAFVQYMLDSSALSGHPLRTSQLGRYNGVAYYVLGGFGIGSLWLADMGIRLPVLGDLGTLVRTAAWVLLISSLASMLDRAVSFWRLGAGR